MEHLHTDYYGITSCHADFTHRLSPASLFGFLQESAWRHANSRGFGLSHLAEENTFWVLAKMHVRIRRLPDWTEQIRAETWSKQPELLTAYRDFEFFDADNQSIILAASSWHILDRDTLRPVALTRFADRFPVVARHAIAEKPQKVPLPTSDAVRSGVQTVQPGDIDVNQHVNNTKYVQWALNCIPFAFQKRHVLGEISVNFLSQSYIGERYFVDCYQDGLTFTHLILSAEDNRKLAAVQSRWKE